MLAMVFRLAAAEKRRDRRSPLAERHGRPDAHRIRLRLLWRDELLNSHLVFPTIGKVVLVQKAFIHTKVEIDQPDVSSIPRVPGTAAPRDPILLAANAEAMKVVNRSRQKRSGWRSGGQRGCSLKAQRVAARSSG